MSDEQRLQIITAQLVLVRDNLFRGMSKSMQKLQARSINEVLELPNFTKSPQRPDWAQQLPGSEIFDRSNDAKDAVRYRWIREQYYYPPGTLLDQAIDAAIREVNK